MKRILIISPHFPPVNAADMHRVRQSLPYFKEFGWEPVVIAVDEKYVEGDNVDPFLLYTVPADIEVHKVKAWNINSTRKFGLGSLSMRSFFHFKKKGDELLKSKKFDLIYFSTTAFHVMALGPMWKKKFGVPFVLDIQDPWRRDFYLDKPKNERPPKFFVTYNVDKWLEAYTVVKAAGIISVSQGYCDTFMKRYTGMKADQFSVIPFGASAYDFEIMQRHVHSVNAINLNPKKINVVYAGRGGHDMKFALEIIFKAFAKGLAEEFNLFSRLHFSFIGTSYAPAGKGTKTVLPVAQLFNVAGYVTEITDRIPYFQTLFLLKNASLLLIPGSTDTSYTASKIYPYILAGKPLLALFYKESSVVKVLSELKYGTLVTFDHTSKKADDYVSDFYFALKEIVSNPQDNCVVNKYAFEPYSARAKTLKQIGCFEKWL